MTDTPDIVARIRAEAEIAARYGQPDPLTPDEVAAIKLDMERPRYIRYRADLLLPRAIATVEAQASEIKRLERLVVALEAEIDTTAFTTEGMEEDTDGG